MSKIYKALQVVGASRIFSYLLFKANKNFQKKHKTKSLFETVQFVQSVDDRYAHCKFTIEGRLSRCKLRRRGSDFHVFEQVILQKEYALLKRASELLKTTENMVVVDAGANVGLFTLYANSLFKNASFVCIEPNVENYDLMLENLAKNEVKLLKGYCKALWNSEGTISIGHQFRDHMDWSYSVIKGAESTLADEVETVTIKQMMHDNNLLHIDILKIDIEGAEKTLLEDKETQELIFSKVSIFIVELHEEVYTSLEFIRLLDRYDFRYLHEGETFFAFKKSLLK